MQRTQRLLHFVASFQTLLGPDGCCVLLHRKHMALKARAIRRAAHLLFAAYSASGAVVVVGPSFGKGARPG